MKKVAVIIVAIGFMVAGSYSFAQDGDSGREKKERVEKSPVEKAEKRTERMQEDLNLSDNQADEIRQINLSHIQEMEELKQQIQALKAEAKAKREVHKEAIDEVLTEEQRQLHEEKMSERKKKHEEQKKQRDRKRLE